MKHADLIRICAGAMFVFGFGGASFAQVKKCTLPDGTVRYSDIPCTEKESEKSLSVPSTSTRPSEPKMEAVPVLSPEAKAHEAERAKARERSKAETARQDEYLRRAREASAEVQRLKRENYDPAKCQAARARIAIMERRDPIGVKFDIDYGILKQEENLYCGN